MKLEQLGFGPSQLRWYLCVCSSNSHSFRFSSSSAAFCFLSSTVASQLPEALKAALTTSNCCRPGSWMYSCCTMSSCGKHRRPRVVRPSRDSVFALWDVLSSSYVVQQFVSLERIELKVARFTVDNQSFAARVHHQARPDTFSCSRTQTSHQRNLEVCFKPQVDSEEN